MERNGTEPKGQQEADPTAFPHGTVRSAGCTTPASTYPSSSGGGRAIFYKRASAAGHPTVLLPYYVPARGAHTNTHTLSLHNTLLVWAARLVDFGKSKSNNAWDWGSRRKIWAHGGPVWMPAAGGISSSRSLGILRISTLGRWFMGKTESADKIFIFFR